ncbi:MAG: hypothetical protein CL763_07075 [Chloroflexi bacterium]|nr:hypothetical protein [Chloroflexota bacterium]|tara:strand:+ start:2420 stop:3109 length:690 start_codon:yes stop_codon:yes gene_type:complete
MDALILAAGKGTRLGLDNLPKCLIQFENLTLIEYQINCLFDLGIKNIFVVTGYNSEKIEEKLGDQVTYIHNKEFATTNNIKSIFLAEKFLKDDFICIYGDLFFHKKILKKCIDSKNQMTLMVENELRNETTRVKMENGKIILVNKNIEFSEADGNFIGMMKCSKDYSNDFFKTIEELVESNSQAYYTIGIEKMIKNGKIVNFEITNGLPWTDIDTNEDLLLAKEIFVKG